MTSTVRSSCARKAWLVVLVVCCAAASLQGRLQVHRDEIVAEVRRLIAAERDPLGDAVPATARAWLQRLYTSAPALVWLDDAGRPGTSVPDALAALEHADDHGLDPSDYRAHELVQLTAAVQAGVSPAQAAALEVGLSLNMLRYLHHVHTGRVDPRSVGFGIDPRSDDAELIAILRAGVTQHRLSAAIDDLLPHVEQYAKLRAALAQYRALAREPRAPARLPARLIRPGDRLTDAATLHNYLSALGDIPAVTAAPGPALYDRPLADGIVRFQRRHGLQADGVIGPATRAALNVPLSWRVRQIELALERLRWLPPLGDGPVIALNIPMFHLWGWDQIPSDSAIVSMNAIVGQAFKTETPIFVGEMRYVIFRPYWNVPPSILTAELLPIISRDRHYLDREGFEIVQGVGDDVSVLPVTPASLRLLRRGGARLRQRPGSKNALGLIEFLFPNASNVYMHGTPTPELFARTRRDFSHGCIRVEDPIALAEWVLQGADDWTREHIVAATEGADHVRVDLARPIRVVIFYTTAAVAPEDGAVHFADDIYGHDVTLDKALQALRVR